SLLADREPRNPRVGAECVSKSIHDRARPEDLGRAATEKAPVVVIGHETDVLALGLVGRDESQTARLGAHVVLRELADWKPGGGELALRQRPEEIGLVLADVPGPEQEMAPGRRIARDPRIMAGGHRGGIPRAGASQQRPEL